MVVINILPQNKGEAISQKILTTTVFHMHKKRLLATPTLVATLAVFLKPEIVTVVFNFT